MRQLIFNFAFLVVLITSVGSCTSAPTTAPTPFATVIPTPAPIPADHAGRTTCFVCHQTGVGGASVFPSGHESSADTLTFCQVCHKGPPGGLPPAPTSTPVAATAIPGATLLTPTPANLPTATPRASTSAPAIPADHQGRATCRACHAGGIGPSFPTSPDHTGFPDSLVSCQACHKGP